MTELILSCLATFIFVVYNITAISLFGVPVNLSSTYYLFNSKKENLGWLFTGMLWTVCFLLVYPWISLTENMFSWTDYFTFLPFLAIGCILFVGAAPNFKDKWGMESPVHIISALCAALFSILWICIVAWPFAWVILVWAVLLLIVAICSKTLKICYEYWLEMVAFMSTFTVIIITSAILV